VRQVAKSLTFPTTEYTANSLNANRTVPLILKDVNDSTMLSSPLMRWRSSDTTVFTIDSITGILRVKKVDTARIIVRVDTILNRSQKLRVDQALAGLTKFAGDAASDTVGRLVTVPPTVTAVDSGNPAAGIAGDTVIFRVGSGSGLITDSVKITDVNGRATVGSWQLGNVATAQTLIATSGTRSATFTVTGIPQRPFKLGFGVQPRSTASATSITPPVTVTIRDSLNNVVTTATDSVFVALGNNPGTATLSGARRAAAVNGIATFSNLSVSASASGYTLVASGLGALESAVSNAFDIFGTATKLAITRQPVATSAGALLDTILVAVQDAAGTTVANDTRNVTLAIGTNAGSGTLSGSTTVAAVNGVAMFTGLSINNAGNGYTLQATASPLTPVTTTAFNVNPVGAASKLAFTTQPPATFASGASPTIAVAVQDANGATVGTSSASVSIQLVSSTGAALTGTVSRNAVNGIATFTGISVNKVGTGYKISATSTGLTSAESTPFSVTPGTATKLAFVTQPTHTVVSTTMSPSVTVAVMDGNDNVVTGVAPTSVTVALSSCTGPTITGGTSANSASGVATFSALAFGPTTGISCRLTASATGLTGGTSDLFSIVSTTGAIRLSFGTQPTTTTAGNSIPSFTVRAVDQSGAVVTSAAPFITLTVLSGPGTIFSGASATASSGTATFSSTQIRTAGSYKLLATATGFKPDSTNVFTINAATLSKLGFVQQPGDITAGVPFAPAIAVAFQDTYGNTITSQTSNITLERNQGPFNGNLTGGVTTVAAQNGVATFNGLTIKVANGSYNLIATTSAGASFSVSNFFAVTAGPPASLGFTSHPPSFPTAGDQFGVTVQAQDSVGNVLSSFTNQVTLSLTGGDPAATLLGTTTMTPTSGSAAFTGLSVQKSGSNYRINASASGLSTGQSNAFTVSAGSATKLAWLDTPQNTVQNAGIDNGSGQLVRVAAQDQYGNTASFFSTIRIAIGTNPGGIQMKDGGFTTTFKDYSPSGGTISLSNLTFSGSGNGLTLLATTPFSALTSATSAAFNVAAFGAKAKLVFKTQPSNGTYAVALNPAVEVRIEDDFGNTVTDATDQVTIVKANDPVGATTVSGGAATAAVAGVASFSGLYLDKAGTGFTVEATATGLTSVVSSAFNITSPGNLAVSSNIADMTRIGSRIYWIEVGASASLKSVSVTGGAVTTHTATGNAARIATDGTNVFWIESGSGVGTGSVKRMDVASGTVTTLAGSLSDVRTEANTFTTDGSFVYFQSRNTAATSAAIRRVAAYPATPPATPVDLYSVAPNNTSATQYFTISGNSVSGGFIYFFDNPTSSVRRMALDGTSVTSLTPSLFVTIQRLAFSGTTLYVSAGSDIRTIASADTRSTTVTPSIPVAGLSFLYNMVIEGNNLYVKDNSNVRRYDVTSFGGTAIVTTLATNGRFDYQTLLLDSAHLYYSHNSSGIGKVLK